MENNIEELQSEIEKLSKRVAELEKSHRRQKAYKYLKLLIKLVIIGAIVFGIWKAYDYIKTDLPNKIEEKVKSLIPFR